MLTILAVFYTYAQSAIASNATERRAHSLTDAAASTPWTSLARAMTFRPTHPSSTNKTLSSRGRRRPFPLPTEIGTSTPLDWPIIWTIA